MKRWFILLILSLFVLNISAEDNDDSNAVLVFYRDNQVDCYKADEVEDISHIASNENISEPDILRILVNGNQYEYLLSEVDSVVFTPPSKFFTIQTRTVTTRSYLTATLRSTIGGNWDNWSAIERGFYIYTQLLPPKDEQPLIINCGKFPNPGTIDTLVSHRKHGLIGNKLYYYKAYARYGKFIIFGNPVPFRLQPVIIWTSLNPIVEEDDMHEGCYKTKVDADIFGDTDEIGEDPDARIGFYYDTVEDPDRQSKTAIRQEGHFTEVGDIEAVLDKLEPGKKYYYRPFVEIADTIYYGISGSFVTSPSVTVNTGEVYNVGAASATVDYSLDVKMYEGQLKGGVVGIQFALTPDLDGAGEDSYHPLDNWNPNSNSSFNASFTKLIPNTTYYYRAYAIIDGKTYYGKDILSFTTGTISVITTYNETAITSTTATVFGELQNKDAINEGDQYGFYLKLTGNPGPDNSVGVSGTFDSTSNGKFYWNITGLTPSTTYYCRAVITYKGKVYPGDEISFTTEKEDVVYNELGLFELKGPVKSCKWTNIYGSNTRTFNENGMWMTHNGNSLKSIYRYGIDRDAFGRIVTGYYDEGGNESWTYDDKGRKTEYTDVLWDGGETHTFTYGDNDLVIKETVEMLGMDVEWNDDYTLTFSNHVFDDHGNWISRTRHLSTDGSTSIETRVITYYE